MQSAVSFAPLGFVLKFDPPIIGLVYNPIEKKKINKKKKKMYTIHLNNLIFLVEPEDIVEQLFQEHPDFLDPNIVKPEQIFKLVLRLVAYRDHQLKNMQDMDDDDDYYDNYQDQDTQQQRMPINFDKLNSMPKKSNENNRSF